jgi:hypothetical protein
MDLCGPLRSLSDLCGYRVAGPRTIEKIFNPKIAKHSQRFRKDKPHRMFLPKSNSRTRSVIFCLVSNAQSIWFIYQASEDLHAPYSPH